MNSAFIFGFIIFATTSNNIATNEKVGDNLEFQIPFSRNFSTQTNTSPIYIDHKNSNDKINSENTIQLIRSQIKREIQKLKSTITDSIMEELINYYGKKLGMTQILENEVASLNEKFNLSSQKLNQLEQNVRTVSKNHRNLVDIVRNNLINHKKESVKKLSDKSNLKKKSIDLSRFVSNSTQTNGLFESKIELKKTDTSLFDEKSSSSKSSINESIDQQKISINNLEKNPKVNLKSVGMFNNVNLLQDNLDSKYNPRSNFFPESNSTVDILEAEKNEPSGIFNYSF